MTVTDEYTAVGTQARAGSIQAALRDARPNPVRALENDTGELQLSERGEMQKGILPKSGITPRLYRIPAPSKPQLPGANGSNTLQPIHNAHDAEPNRGFERVETDRWTRLGRNIGDEPKEGPIFNHWRVFTWWKTADIIAGAFDTRLDYLRDQRDIGDSAHDIAESCGLFNDHSSIEAYPEWKSIPSALWYRLLVAVVAAMGVQWGTAGAGRYVVRALHDWGG